MARVTITFEDVTCGQHDGGVEMLVGFDPVIRLHEDGTPEETLTPAQMQALDAITHISLQYPALGNWRTMERSPS